MAQQSRILILQGRCDEALDIRRRIVEERRELYRNDPKSMLPEFGGALCSYGELLREMGRFAEAERSYSEALPLIERLAASDPTRLDNLWRLARENEEYAKVLLPLRRWKDGRAHLERAIGIYREIRAQDPDAMSNQRALAVCLGILGKELSVNAHPSEGLRKLREAVQLSGQAARHDRASRRAQTEFETLQAELSFRSGEVH